MTDFLLDFASRISSVQYSIFSNLSPKCEDLQADPPNEEAVRAANLLTSAWY